MTTAMDRRQFLKAGAATAIGTAIGGRLAASAQTTAAVESKAKGSLIWANLLHLSYNMWYDWEAPEVKGRCGIYHPDLFFKKMPKSVLQSNWYYGTKFDKDVPAVKAYVDLDEHGYDQVPTGSNWSSPKNFGGTVDYCRQHIAPQRLFGFMQTIWQPTIEACRQRHTEGLDQVAGAIATYGAKK